MQANRIQSEMQQLGSITLLTSSDRKGDPHQRGGGEEVKRTPPAADRQEISPGQRTPKILPNPAIHHELPSESEPSTNSSRGESDEA